MKIKKILPLFLTFWLVNAVICLGSETKVLLIGIDGLTWRVINPLVRENRLPDTAKLIKRGVYGNLESLDPSLSPLLWTSIATGKRPEKHDIWGWDTYEKRKSGPVPFRSFHRKTKAIWNILSENGKSVGVCNWLITWPPEKVNGFMVPFYWDWTEPSQGLDLFYPRELVSELPQTKREEYFRNLKINSEQDEWLGDFNYELSLVSKISSYLQNKEKVDFFTLYLEGLDPIQHKFWKFMEPEHFDRKIWNLTEENIAKYKNVIRDSYEQTDQLLGQLLNRIDEDTVVIVVSDHGFRPVTGLPGVRIDFDKILEKVGLLKFKPNSKEVDLSQTKAYSFKPCLGVTRIYVVINVVDKNSSEFKQLRSQLVDLVSNIRNPGGETVFEEVNEKVNLDEAYADKVDLIIDQTETTFIGEGDKPIYIYEKKYPLDSFIIESPSLKDVSGGHDKYDGVIIIAGRNIKKGVGITDATLLDITPTILYLMGLPVAKDMDGKVLTQAIEPSFLEKNPIRYIDSYDKKETIQIPKKEEITPYDKELLEKLKALGYIQ